MGVFLIFSSCLNSSPWLDPQIIFLYVLRGYLESGIGLITTLTLTRTLTLKLTLTHALPVAYLYPNSNPYPNTHSNTEPPEAYTKFAHMLMMPVLF